MPEFPILIQTKVSEKQFKDLVLYCRNKGTTISQILRDSSAKYISKGVGSIERNDYNTIRAKSNYGIKRNLTRNKNKHNKNY